MFNAIRILALGVTIGLLTRATAPRRPSSADEAGGKGMTVTTGLCTRSTVARAGGMYLAYILASVLASRLGHIGLSDAPTLRATIFGDEAMFRLGLVAALASALLFVLTAWALYALRRPVHEPLALLLLVLNAVGAAAQWPATSRSSRSSHRGTAPWTCSRSPARSSTGWPCCPSPYTGEIVRHRLSRAGNRRMNHTIPHRRRYPDPPWQNTRPPLNLR